MRSIRTAARALIIIDRRLLAIKMQDRSGVFYILPGGGQHHGETLQEGLRRECLEEIGTAVEVGELLYVREYIGKNHGFRSAHRAFHQLEHVFRCTLPDPGGIGPGSELDKKQVGVEWLPLEQLKAKRFLPEAVIPGFSESDYISKQIYLGDIN